MSAPFMMEASQTLVVLSECVSNLWEIHSTVVYKKHCVGKFKAVEILIMSGEFPCEVCRASLKIETYIFATKNVMLIRIYTQA